MRRVVVRLLGTLGLVAGLGCNGSPGGPSATVVDLMITPPSDVITLAATSQLSLTASLSDGGTRSVQGTWGSDTPSVVMVTSAGLATGVAAGRATVFADYEGQRATRLFLVLPDYAGSWEGGYRVVGCAESGDWVGTCADEDPSIEWFLQIVLTQDRTIVQGTLVAFEDRPVPIQGTVATDGRLTAAGSQTDLIDGADYELVVSGFEVTTTDNLEIRGQFDITGRVAGLAGEYRLTCELSFVTRASVPTSASPSVVVVRPTTGVSARTAPGTR